MRIHKKQKNNKVIIIISVITVLLAALVFAWFNPAISFFGVKHDDRTNIQPENTVDYNPPTDEQKAAGEDQKKETATPNLDTKPDNSTEGSELPGGTLTVTITGYSQSGGQLDIRTLINGVVSNDGACMLTLTKGSTAISKSGATEAMPNSSTCASITVPVSELSNGEWKAKILVTAGSKKGSVEQAIQVQ